VELSRTFDSGFPGFEARATATLIRDVERYGAARPDIESQEDYLAHINESGGNAPELANIVTERLRYEVARRPEEIVSVFRATMPIVEGLVRRLLRAHGSTREHGSLGPMIGELRDRNIGTRGLWSQLTALLNNVRDISLHGEEVPVAVLRIAAEGCFELFPQLLAAFPEAMSRGS
jgi:hypothetical protein